MFSLTELGASHEVVSCLFGVFAMHFASLWVKLGEHMSMEAVIVLHKAESRCAVWHGLELSLIHCLGLDIKVVYVVSYRKIMLSIFLSYSSDALRYSEMAL